MARQQGQGALLSDALRGGDRDSAVSSPHPAHAYGFLVLVASYAQLGSNEEVRRALADIRALPAGSEQTTRWYLDRYADLVTREHMADGLRKAGLIKY